MITTVSVMPDLERGNRLGMGIKIPFTLRRATMTLCAALLLMVGAGANLAQTGWTGTQVGPAGKDLNAVYFADTRRGWIGGDNGFVTATTDEGRTWSRQSVATNKPISDIYFPGNDNGYLLAGDEIFGTSDGGQTWKLLRRFQASEFENAEPDLYSVRFEGKKKGWVVGSLSRNNSIVDSILLFTDDAGVTWQRRRLPTREELIHLDFIDDKRGWVVGESGTILHTADGGASWTSQQSGVTQMLKHVDFRNDKVGWVVGERGTILRTTNGGNTWVPVESNVRSTLLSVQFVGEDRGWVAGRGGVILRSEDGGQTWLRQLTGTTVSFYALFIGKKTGWAVGGDGMVLQYAR